MGSNLRINKTREILRDNPDGLTARQLNEILDMDNMPHMYRILKTMPDAYIDRWKRTGKRLSAVWCVVVPPPNCPKP
jgi:hypothetical protein